METGDQKPEAQPAGGPTPIGPERSGKLVVLVFVGAAVVLIGGSAALLRWARNKSYESLVQPPSATSAPVSPGSGSPSQAPETPPKP
jgi:hypothetical protein